MQARYEVGIFFELKHYKPNKSRNSTRCWAFFELDEIIDGEIRCEWVSIYLLHTYHINCRSRTLNNVIFKINIFHAIYKLSLTNLLLLHKRSIKNQLMFYANELNCIL